MTTPGPLKPESSLRKGRRTWLLAVLTLAAVAIVVGVGSGLFLLSEKHRSQDGCCHTRILSVGESRRAFQDSFQQADRLEVYAQTWPSGVKLRALAVVNRKDDPQRWEAWIRDLGNAREATYPQINTSTALDLQLFKGTAPMTRLFGMEWGGPEQQLHAAVPGGEARVECDSSSLLYGFFRPLENQLSEIVRHAPPPPAPERKPYFVAGPAARNFQETKARVVKIFETAALLEVLVRHEGGNSDIQGEGRRAWKEMVKAVKQSQPGGPVKPVVDLQLFPSSFPDHVRRSGHFYYFGSVLSSDDPYYGGDVYTLEPGPGFDKAVTMRCRIAVTRYRRQMREAVEKARRPLPPISSKEMP